MAYAADVDRVQLDLEAYDRALGGLPVSVVPPSITARLRERREPGGEARARPQARRSPAVHFYHYGFLRLEALDMIRAALEA